VGYLCRLSHTSRLIPKYIVKAISGYHHVSAFTLGNIPDAIRAKESSKEVVQENCERCHAETIANINEGLMGITATVPALPTAAQDILTRP
jgi:cytochrome c nitrite reductase small subunit